MTVRVDDSGRAVHDGPQVEIGGNERYISVSRAEFKKIVRGEGRIEPLQERLPLEAQRDRRSEEHTSELQSLMRSSYAVFCLHKKTTQQHETEEHTVAPNT